jgi:hypothetical protein
MLYSGIYKVQDPGDVDDNNHDNRNRNRITLTVFLHVTLF